MFKMDTFIYLAKFEKDRTILTCLNYQSNLFVTNGQNKCRKACFLKYRYFIENTCLKKTNYCSFYIIR